MYENVRFCESVSYSAAFSSSCKLLAPLIPEGKVTFCKLCQDFYLMANILCRQMNVSVHILSVPYGVVLYQLLPLTHTHTHAHRELFPHHSH